MEIFLAKLFGLYFIIIGAIVLIRQKSVMPSVKALAQDRPLLLFIAVVEIVAGLALTLVYPTVSMSAEGILSIVGYMMVVEGIIYLAAPAKFIQRFIKIFNQRAWYISGGILSVGAGIYLAGIGFGFF